jgi:hypothetical protein
MSLVFFCKKKLIPIIKTENMEKIHIIRFGTFTINGYNFDTETASEELNILIAGFVKSHKPKTYRIVNTDLKRDDSATTITVFIAYEE